MGHDKLQTTDGYCSVSESRIREAEDRVSTHLFDASGGRVFSEIKGLLAEVHLAVAQMHADGSEITVSAVAERARVHRSFIHRHPALHSAVLSAAAATISLPSSVKLSRRSALAANANLQEHNRRPAQQVKTSKTDFRAS